MILGPKAWPSLAHWWDSNHELLNLTVLALNVAVIYLARAYQ